MLAPHGSALRRLVVTSLLSFLSPSPGNFGSILSTKERPTGNYPVTTATLNLLLKLIQGISVAKVTNIQPINFLDLAACNLFVMREIFTGFHKWRYVRVKDREEIGECERGPLGLTSLLDKKKMNHLIN